MARGLKKVWNMKLTVVPLVGRALGTPAKAYRKDWRPLILRERLLNYKKLSWYRILQNVLEVWRVLLTLYLKNKAYSLVEINGDDYSIIIIVMVVQNVDMWNLVFFYWYREIRECLKLDQDHKRCHAHYKVK